MYVLRVTKTFKGRCCSFYHYFFVIKNNFDILFFGMRKKNMKRDNNNNNNNSVTKNVFLYDKCMAIYNALKGKKGNKNMYKCMKEFFFEPSVNGIVMCVMLCKRCIDFIFEEPKVNKIH